MAVDSFARALAISKSNAYTKSETDTLLNAKADKATTYTKTETDTKITEKVAEIVADAPEDFDTLKEMSDWISHHEESAAAMNSAIKANATAITGKVDKETGKGLSTEDYTTAEKTKLSGIETGAEVNVQSDWGQSDSTADDFIKNKPTLGSAASRNVSSTIIPYGTELLPSGTIYSELSYKVDKIAGKRLSTEDYTTAEKNKLAGLSNYDDTALQTTVANKVDKVTGKGLSTEDYTTAEKTKLAGIETGAEANIQSDWEQSDNTADDFIKNKPTLGSAASRSVVLSLSNAGSGLPTSGTVYSALVNKVDKVTGKGLSTEDYTTAEKNKLAVLSELDTATVTIDLNSQTWTESANGLFYTGNISVTNLYRALSAIITGFSALKTTDNVAVIANSDKTAIRLTASTNTFSNQANITVSVFGRFTS
ncbi:MAG: hypothetical protein J6S85_13740 [Methanobrevibacter sp.]|nr:hypothetical protein [Methanobrevibacter sp.]